jgi:NADP-dependent 3-hydroxy acid dehydrogenase YdfG
VQNHPLHLGAKCRRSVAQPPPQRPRALCQLDGDEQKAAATYNGFDPLIAADIADAAWFMASRPAHVCINDMIIMPTAQANATSFHKV